MSTRCNFHINLGDPPAVAWLIHATWRGRMHFCQGCLDRWFDDADDNPRLEPAAWGWLYGCRPPATGGTVQPDRPWAVVGEGAVCTLMVPPPERRPNLGISINITDMAAALADPANHQALMTALRRESRIQGKPLHQLTGRN
jgi:hypothetical protein